MNAIERALHQEVASVVELCRRLGLGEVAPTVLASAHHTTLLLSPLSMVARVQSHEPIDAARRRAAREVAVARHLAGRGAPALAPVEGLAGPHAVPPSVVTFWPHVDGGRAAVETDAAPAAAALAGVHRVLLDHGGGLPTFTRMLDRCWRVLADDGACAALGPDDRGLLRAQFRRLRRVVGRATDGWTPLHGDAHVGNFLVGGDRSVWVDFEDACVGPREWDVACLPHAAWARFGDVDPTLVHRCADLRSVCVAVWCWAGATRDPAAREAAEHHLGRVRGLPF